MVDPGTGAMIGGLFGGAIGSILAGGKQVTLTSAQIMELLRERKPALLEKVSIDTSEARSAKPYLYTGYAIYVENPETPTASVEIALNEAEAYKQTLTDLRHINTPFYQFFITNEAGAGVLNLTIIKAPGLEVSEAQVGINIVASSVTIDVDITAQAIGDLTISINAATIMAPVDVQGSYIQMPIDVQGSFIMMPVDIQAQLINLEIDIVAQSIGNIAIDIAAATMGDIAIDINAQTIGDITISIDAQAIGVSSQPDWQTEQGKSKGQGLYGDNIGEGVVRTSDYEVSAGKVLYIYGMTGRWNANDVADADLNQFASVGVTGQVLGGNGGANMHFPIPLKFLATETATLSFVNRANHHLDYYVYWKGYEVDA